MWNGYKIVTQVVSFNHLIIKMERWKKVEGYDYEISDLSNLRSLDRVVVCKDWRRWEVKWQRIKTHKIQSWYWKINFKAEWWRKAMLIHRLVYCTFNDEDYYGKFDVWHYDDDPDNYRLDNLYKTNQERNANNRKLAYKLLWLWRGWLIKLPEGIDIDVEL